MVAPSENVTIIYILFSIKVFLLVTKHTPKAVEQQGELQNDGSLSLVAPRSFKRKKNAKLEIPLPENLLQNAKLVEVSDIRLTTGKFRPGFYYTENATTTTQKQSDYKVEQSSFTLIALF